MKQRVITGLLAGALFIGMLLLGSNWYAAFILIMALIGYQEFIAMHGLKSANLSAILGFVSVVCLVAPWEKWFETSSLLAPSTLWWLMFVLLAITVLSKNKFTLEQAATLLLGAIYIGFGFHYMLSIRLDHGIFWTLLVFVCLWATDSGAYFTGWAFGKRLLWPAISPKKTVEGALGGILLSVIAALVFYVFAPHLLNFKLALLAGASIAIIGQAGDLMQSAYKRARGVKDSGHLLPGHGGILDRCDSWLIVFPFVYFSGLFF